MSDTERAADRDPDHGPGTGSDARRTERGDPPSSALVPAVGTVLSAVTAAALLVPVRRGVDEPTLQIAGALAVVATGAFLARRHALLERRRAGPIAAGASLLVVVLSGYVITQGVLGSAVLPGLGWSISLLFTAFFVAAGSVGVGVADYVGLSSRGLTRRASHMAEMFVLAFVSLFGIAFAFLFLSLPLALVVGEPTPLQETLVEYASTVVALGGVTIGYLRLRGRDRSFIDLEMPTLRTVGWLVGGVILLVGTNTALGSLLSAAGAEGAEHTTVQQVAENPNLLVVIIPAMVFIVGPFEELLYRNIIQKSLYDTFSRYGAIVVASVVFTSVHISAYSTAGANRILVSLALLFVLSLILGALYERTENLLVPALVHGCYNAAVFLIA
ncbi:hypothetical protein SAMN05444422_101384 [Halobiforma haloterrestris]|uniref:CAAX prenyl protease 2/Lysostaphin resistance protein A-like domain-containing protein n=1 Tax=Natronobacterium haloterrestre TaxID=148448 RepID=A0A1I1D9P9_NATHA|nr:CPBP family intramembrane glutamic endopeptidase [Halobiforma haloterrestris]SFB71072.1 hypothetical protein SAMN05444422_101384 [Halobiforma haloterrestris]